VTEKKPTPRKRAPPKVPPGVDLSTVPDVLLQYQKDWIADRASVKVAEKGRRIGWTYATAPDAVDTAARAKEAGGMDVWYLGHEKTMAAEFIQYCAFFARFVDEAASEIEESVLIEGERSINTYSVRFSSGFRITALSSRPAGLRGRQGYVIIDEAAHHNDLQEAIDAAMPLLIWGGRLAIISTHFGADNYFNEIVEDIKAKRNDREDWSLHTVDFDKAIEQGLYKRVCFSKHQAWTQAAQDKWRAEIVKKAGRAAAQELFCQPSNTEGAYLSRQLIEERMFETPTPIVSLECDAAFKMLPEGERIRQIDEWYVEHLTELLDALPRNCQHALGGDFGRVTDLTVFAPLTLQPDLTRRVPFVVELRNVPFEAQKQVLFFILERLPHFFGACLDAGGNGAYLAEVAAQQWGEERVREVRITERWYSDNLPPFRAAFEDATLLVPRHALILSDLRMFQVIRGKPKMADVRNGDKGKPRHGDAGIALLMAHVASRLEVEEYGFHAASLTSTASDTQSWPHSERERQISTTSGVRRSSGGVL
jgi:phage FluMu gp28-like protein